MGEVSRGVTFFFFFGLNKKLRCQVDESYDKEKRVKIISMHVSTLQRGCI